MIYDYTKCKLEGGEGNRTTFPSTLKPQDCSNLIFGIRISEEAASILSDIYFFVSMQKLIFHSRANGKND